MSLVVPWLFQYDRYRVFDLLSSQRELHIDDRQFIGAADDVCVDLLFNQYTINCNAIPKEGYRLGISSLTEAS